MLTRIPARKELEQLGVYQPGKPIEEVKRQFGLSRIIKLASNENPFGYSPMAKEAMLQEMDKVTLYPEATAPELVEHLSVHLGVPGDEILLGNGSDELIRLITRSYIRQGDEAIMADVTFPRYETNVLIDGGSPVKVPLVDGVHDLEGMLAAITSKTRMIFVCNPNNPTGTIVGREALRNFIEQVPADILVIVDEAYYEYVTDPNYLQTLPLIDLHPNLLVLRTFSKVYGLAALRVGYAIAQADVLQSLTKVKDAFNTNRLAQAAALGALKDQEYVAFCRDKNAAGRHYLEQEFDRMGIRYFPSQGNFVLVNVLRSGDEVFASLLERGIIVRSGRQCDAYPDTIRVTIGTEEQNEAFIAALSDCLK
ncbi:histidinol-phosphate transaminase [Alicyclobacillus fastidiosus]|uniref:Histidinol-phosphate aminotransferase n=1 Tax=Alicyclobacillus fastidiosus TaxID=392011 RepID=A0ABV5ABX2_9BACL|nr:histidinol-phosphate transaminase [Alicyclobacillus fastidiosus]WEH11895.1 histidinol-phosphate transaminase [Alicyclobacillus fastidiosus]